jgi:hypothetical protein
MPYLAFDDDLARRLPLPLAKLYRRGHNSEEPLERHQAALYLWETIFKLLGSTAIIAYAERKAQDPTLSRRLQNLARPSLGHWCEWIRLLVPVLAEAKDDGFVPMREALGSRIAGGKGKSAEPMAALARAIEGYLRTGDPAAGDGSKSPRVSDIFDQVVTYRNRALGHGALGLARREMYDEMGAALLGGAADLLGRLDVLAGRKLVYVVDVRRQKSGAWRIEQRELMGETERRLEPRDIPDSKAAQLPRPECAYLASSDGLRLLHPLLVYEPQSGDIFFLNSRRDEKQTEYLCYTTGQVVVREELEGEQRELLARVLGTPVDSNVAGAWAAQAQAEEEEAVRTTEAPTKNAPPTDASAAPMAPESAGPAVLAKPLRLALLYRRNIQPDEQLLTWLERELTARRHEVFVDRHMTIGVEWARELERQLREADAVIALLSASSVQSEMIAGELQIAHDEAQKRQGRPRILPVRINSTDKFPAEIASILDRLQYFLWQSAADNERLLAELIQAFRQAPPIRDVSPPAGVVPLDSKFYVVRPTDEQFQSALARQDSVVLIRGARQAGKTSLLARGLQQARTAGVKVVMTDFQKLNLADLESVESLFRTLGAWIADELDLTTTPDDVWAARRGPSVNFERYLRREVLDKLQTPLVWALDEVDRLFSYPFGSEVFGLFRSWHNDRALRPDSPWSRLTLAISYATEAHLFITDMNQSPFNVGTLLVMEDFSPEQVADLNRRYGNPVADDAALRRFYELVGGHPYLANRGLYEMVQKGLDPRTLEDVASKNDGIFGDHLRRILVLLAKDPALCDVVRGVLRGQPCPTPESFYRLRSAGLLAGDSARSARFRCKLYAIYLERHLL